jgi:hypothetical protein
VRQINPNIFPPSGYRFVERDGTVFTGSGWRNVERKVIAYRKGQGADPGDVWNEMMNQVCGEVPGFCREADGSPTPAPKNESSGLSFNARINEWMAWALGRKRLHAIKTVPTDQVARRAAICAVCPRQLALTASCGACIVAIKSARQALQDGAEPAFQNLHPCGVLKEDCVSSIHMALPPSNNPELPAECWRRQ